MFASIVSWFGHELWLALSGIVIAAGIDCALSATLALVGKASVPFSWRKLPQFLATNVLPYAVGLIGGAVLVKYVPDLKVEYLGAAGLLSAYLAKDWRAKAKLLFGIVAPPQQG